MDIRKAASDDGVRWYLSGSIDDDSILHLESLVLNSQDMGGRVTLDLSGLESLPSNGAKSIAHISKRLSLKCKDFEITGANHHVTRSLKYSGLMSAQ